MDNRFILTAFGKDRPGIVADVTGILYENGCNLEDNSMTRLADEFTLIMLFTCPGPDIQETIVRECRRLEKEKAVSAFLRPLEQRVEVPGGSGECTLHVEGMDQAGIVYKISRYLSEHGINIIDLKSSVKASPESGTAVYLMDIHVQLPESVSAHAVEEGLSEVADELNVDIALTQ